MQKPVLLLVDDELNSLTILLDFLSDYYEIHSFDDPSLVMKFVEKTKIDTFLLDINMPKIDGLELCKKIKEKKEHIYTPIIFITAFSDIEKIDKGFSFGAVDYITKPFKLQELKIRIDAHLKVAKSQIELRDKHLSLNLQIEQLTKELKEANDKILFEDNFQNRETTFKSTNEKIEQNKINSEIFNKKFIDIQKKLENQKKLLEDAKLKLNFE